MLIQQLAAIETRRTSSQGRVVYKNIHSCLKKTPLRIRENRERKYSMFFECVILSKFSIRFSSVHRNGCISSKKQRWTSFFFLQVLNSTRKFRQISTDHVVVHILENKKLILSLSVEDMFPMWNYKEISCLFTILFCLGQYSMADPVESLLTFGNYLFSNQFITTFLFVNLFIFEYR